MEDLAERVEGVECGRECLDVLSNERRKLPRSAKSKSSSRRAGGRQDHGRAFAAAKAASRLVRRLSLRPWEDGGMGTWGHGGIYVDKEGKMRRCKDEELSSPRPDQTTACA